MEHSRKAQRVELRTCMDLGMRHCEILRHLTQIHGRHALSSSAIHRWMTKIRGGCHDVTVCKSTGRPTKLTPDVLHAIRAILDQDRTTPLQVIAQRHQISLATAHKAVTKALKMKKHPCVWRPHELTAAQRHKRLQLSRHILGMFRRTPALPSHLITMDESWFHLYHCTTKQQGSTWLEAGEPRASKTRQEQATKKVMLSIFWDAQGVIHREFLPQGRGGINARYFLGLLRRFRESVRCKCCQLWRN